MAIAILQARTSSTRLPGKIMLPILDKPMILHQIDRIRKSEAISELIVATSNLSSDDGLVNLLQREGISFHRGPLDDVYQRFKAVVSQFQTSSSVFVRLTADCPLIDPNVIDECIDFFNKNNYHYVSNTLKRTFPRGLDVEVFNGAEFLNFEESFDLSPLDREHVTPIFYSNPTIFNLGSYESIQDNSRYRWTVDTLPDFEFVTNVYEALHPINSSFTSSEIYDYLNLNPYKMHFDHEFKSTF